MAACRSLSSRRAAAAASRRRAATISRSHARSSSARSDSEDRHTHCEYHSYVTIHCFACYAILVITLFVNLFLCIPTRQVLEASCCENKKESNAKRYDPCISTSFASSPLLLFSYTHVLTSNVFFYLNDSKSLLLFSKRALNLLKLCTFFIKH